MGIMIFIIIILFIFSIYCLNSKIKKDNITKEENENIKKENDLLKKDYNIKKTELQHLLKEKENLDSELIKLQKNITETYNNQVFLSQKAYEAYYKTLEDQYAKCDEEFNTLCKNLEEAYANKQLKLLAETEQINTDLDKIRSTRAAAIEAVRREKEMEDNVSFYCIPISELDKLDISKLETIKASLNRPRVLSMVIWQNWFQKPLKALAASVLGTSDAVTGIYKITNIKTKECYIGQSVDIAKRWSEHVKCGLGIDTPQNNKLYKAMQDYGVWNFSFELLEKCKSSLLNEKEKYYIDLYQSKDFGYNSILGINK